MNELNKEETDGIYIIDTGKCKIVNKNDNQEVVSLSRGDFFGESHQLKMPVIIFYKSLISIELQLFWRYYC